MEAERFERNKKAKERGPPSYNACDDKQGWVVVAKLSLLYLGRIRPNQTSGKLYARVVSRDTGRAVVLTVIRADTITPSHRVSRFGKVCRVLLLRWEYQ